MSLIKNQKYEQNLIHTIIIDEIKVFSPKKPIYKQNNPIYNR